MINTTSTESLGTEIRQCANKWQTLSSELNAGITFFQHSVPKISLHHLLAHLPDCFLNPALRPPVEVVLVWQADGSVTSKMNETMNWWFSWFSKLATFSFILGVIRKSNFPTISCPTSELNQDFFPTSLRIRRWSDRLSFQVKLKRKIFRWILLFNQMNCNWDNGKQNCK